MQAAHLRHASEAGGHGEAVVVEGAGVRDGACLPGVECRHDVRLRVGGLGFRRELVPLKDDMMSSAKCRIFVKE